MLRIDIGLMVLFFYLEWWCFCCRAMRKQVIFMGSADLLARFLILLIMGFFNSIMAWLLLLKWVGIAGI